jgi:hypothetical protein
LHYPSFEVDPLLPHQQVSCQNLELKEAGPSSPILRSEDFWLVTSLLQNGVLVLGFDPVGQLKTKEKLICVAVAPLLALKEP